MLTLRLIGSLMLTNFFLIMELLLFLSFLQFIQVLLWLFWHECCSMFDLFMKVALLLVLRRRALKLFKNLRLSSSTLFIISLFHLLCRLINH